MGSQESLVDVDLLVDPLLVRYLSELDPLL
jgi:hypothetical protein